MLGLTFGAVFVDRGAIGVLMPFIVTDLHLTATQVGLVGGALSISGAAANFLAGRASDLPPCWMADYWNPGTPFYLAVTLSFTWGAGALLLESKREKIAHGHIPRYA